MTALDVTISIPEMTAAVDATGDQLGHHSALELVDLLVELRDLTAAVTHLRKRAEAELIGLCGGPGKIDSPHGEVQIRKAKTRKQWDHPLVAYRVASEAIARREPDDDGALEPPEHTAVAAVLDAAGIGYWRTGALRDLGLDPDTYCEVVDDGYAVQLPAREVGG